MIAACAAAGLVIGMVLLVAICVRCHLRRPAVKPSPADIHDAPIVKEEPEEAIHKVMSLEHVQWGGMKPQSLNLTGSSATSLSLKEKPEDVIHRVMSLEHVQWGGHKPQGLSLTGSSATSLRLKGSSPKSRNLPGSPKKKLTPSELLANAGLPTQSIEPWVQDSLTEHARMGEAPWQNSHRTLTPKHINASTSPNRRRHAMAVAATSAPQTQAQNPTRAPLAVTDLSGPPGESPVAIGDLKPSSDGDLRATARTSGNPSLPDALPNAPVGH